MSTFLESLCDIISTGESIALATIASHSGSTPRSDGAQMAIRRDGSILGTIGGGLVEARCIEAGRGLLQRPPGSAMHCAFALDNTTAAEAAMVCGGHLTVIIEHVRTIDDAVDACHAKRQCGTSTGYDLGHDTGCGTGRGIRQDGGLAGILLHACSCAADGLPVSFSVEYVWDTPPTREETPRPGAADRAAPRQTFRLMHAIAHTAEEVGQRHGASGASTALAISEAGCRLEVTLTPPPHLVIFGAGHVAVPTAHFGHAVGFSVTVIDDRPDFANRERFPDARLRIPPSFASAFEGLHVTPDTYLVIMTRGHLHDGEILEQALKTPARYIGMIGSRRKRDALYAKLKQQGIDDAILARCHCPIGLDIQAQTPEEIGISIMAELVLHRASA